jgi:predicted DNA-binding transcriptional regulator AlpA
MSDLIGVEETARISGLSPATVRRYVHRAGAIPAPLPVARPRVLLWERSVIEEWAQARRAPNRPRKHVGDG